jgi:transcriptional regulator with XRE-family HTH domain
VDETYSIKELADKNGLTPAELASRLNVDRDEVNAWFAGKITPSDAHITQLANVFNVTPQQIGATGASARS